MYHEAFQVLLKGLAADELTFEGKFYRFDKVPMILRPVQHPHPPLWYGVQHSRQRRLAGAKRRQHRLAGAAAGGAPDLRALPRGPPQARQETVTLYGVGRHVVVGDTDAQALAIARRAYPRWRANFIWRSSATARRPASPPTIRRPSTNWRP